MIVYFLARIHPIKSTSRNRNAGIGKEVFPKGHLSSAAYSRRPIEFPLSSSFTYVLQLMTRRRGLQRHSQAPLSNEPTHASSTNTMPLPIRTVILLGTPSKILRSGMPEFVRGSRQLACVISFAYILSSPQKLLQSETQAKHTPSIFFLRDTTCHRQPTIR